MYHNASSVAALFAVIAPIGRASPLGEDNRACQVFNIPVTVTSQNALYGTPDIVNNLDAVEYAVHMDTWSTIPSVQRIVQNVTVSGTFSISAQLCTPNTKSTTDKSHVLHIATPGFVFDKR